MAFFLSIETATHTCSVAVHEDGKLVASSELHIAQTAGSKLAVLIDSLIKACQLTPHQLAAVAISSGPGSYTGLRIGVATAKGLCYGLNIPLISINTLELMAYHVKENILSNANLDRTRQIRLCPMLDARRMEVYTLQTDIELNVIKPVEAKVIDEQSFEQELEEGSVIFFGNGSDKCRNVIKHPRAHYIDGIFPSAAMMGKIAYNRWQTEQFENLITFEPLYLKDFLIRKPKEV